MASPEAWPELTSHGASARCRSATLLTPKPDDAASVSCHRASVTRRRNRRLRGGPPLPTARSGPLTLVSWEVDYWYGFPVVDASAEARGVDVLDAERLGIPPDLGQRLAEWADRWEDLAMRHVNGEPPTEWTARAEHQLARDEWTLLDELRRELAPGVQLLVGVCRSTSGGSGNAARGVSSPGTRARPGAGGLLALRNHRGASGVP
jgi:hypothetical protein